MRGAVVPLELEPDRLGVTEASGEEFPEAEVSGTRIVYMYGSVVHATLREIAELTQEMYVQLCAMLKFFTFILHGAIYPAKATRHGGLCPGRHALYPDAACVKPVSSGGI